jgi:hypothetical protein
MTGKGKLKLYIQYIFIFFLVFLIFPSFFYRLPESGLDPSWNISLHLANKYNLVFGKDLVFTYGPFGVLNSRLPISVSKYFYLFFDAYFLATFIFVVIKIFKTNFCFIIACFAFLAITVTTYDAQELWFFFFILFFLFSFLKEPAGKIGYLVQAGFISIFCFYYKLGLGISALAIFLMALSYAVVTKKLAVKDYILILLSYLLVIWICAQTFNVDLLGYLEGSMYIIDAYNDSMFVPLPDHSYRLGYAAVVILGIVVCWILYRLIISIQKKQILKNRDELFIYLLFAMAMYVLFKSAFVRPGGHHFLFFQGMTLAITMLHIFSIGKYERKFTAIACWIVVIISLWIVNNMSERYKPVNNLLNLSFIRIKIDETKRYFEGLKNYDIEVARSENFLVQDNEYRKLVGDHSADIIPFEISKIYFNGLKYNPRPVIQSYSAYDPYLDDLNYKKYMSKDAPDYVFFSTNSIDTRFPFFDETKTKLALINRYRIVTEIDGELALKKRDTPKDLVELEVKEKFTIKLGEEIPIKPSPYLQVTRLFVDYNAWGKLRRLVYQPPLIKIFLTLENDEIRSFRISKSILEDGIILNKFIDNDLAFQLLMRSDGKLNTNIKAMRIESEPENEGLIRTAKMENTYYQFAKKSSADIMADSTAIAALINKYKPHLIEDSIPLQPDSLRYYLEDFSIHGQIIRVSGWAFSEKGDNEGCFVKAILKSGSSIYELPSEKKFRPDLPLAYKRDDLSYCGLTSVVTKSNLPDGIYTLGIGIFSPDNKFARVMYTADTISIGRSENIK